MHIDDTLAHISDITHVDIPETPPEQYKPMTWSKAQELEEMGISFGPHSQTHPILSRVTDEQASLEICQSWNKVKQKLKNPAPVFCYPNGCFSDFGKREIEILKNTDMLGALTTIPKQFKPGMNIPDMNYNLPRYSLPGNFRNFIMYSSWIEYAKEKIFDHPRNAHAGAGFFNDSCIVPNEKSESNLSSRCSHLSKLL